MIATASGNRLDPNASLANAQSITPRMCLGRLVKLSIVSTSSLLFRLLPGCSGIATTKRLRAKCAASVRCDIGDPPLPCEITTNGNAPAAGAFIATLISKGPTLSSRSGASLGYITRVGNGSSNMRKPAEEGIDLGYSAGYQPVSAIRGKAIQRAGR